MPPLLLTPVSKSLQQTHIARLIRDYRDGNDRRAAERLLTLFEAYLKKWHNLLVYARWDRGDAEVSEFLSWLNPDLDTAARALQIRLRAYEPADLSQEVKVAFLETIWRYGTIKRNYRYTLKRRLQVLTKDPTVFNYRDRVSLNDIPEAEVAGGDIDGLWVSGITCGDAFGDLTEEQRRILQLHKWYKLTFAQTAESMGVGIDRIKREYRKAIDMLKPHYLAGA